MRMIDKEPADMTLTELCDALRRPGHLDKALAAEAFKRLRDARRDGDEDTQRDIERAVTP